MENESENKNQHELPLPSKNIAHKLVEIEKKSELHKCISMLPFLVSL